VRSPRRFQRCYAALAHRNPRAGQRRAACVRLPLTPSRLSPFATIQEIEPRPFAFSVLCTAMWIAYGFVSRDPFMFEPNVAGIIVALYCTVATYALAERKVRAPPRSRSFVVLVDNPPSPGHSHKGTRSAPLGN
jgi:hypothetical protein